MGTYYSPAAPTVEEGFLLQPESRVVLGDAYLYGSLETSSWTYASYTASIGLDSGEDLGILESLGFSQVPTFENVEAANIQTSNIWVLTGEETTVTIGLREFQPAVLHQALGTGVLYALGDERLITFGGLCSMTTRPLSIEFSNVACQVPAAEDIANGVSGGVITLYDTFVSSGLPWDAIDAKTLNNVTLEFQARPVLALARGNRLGNMYLF
jgi:hypothetical protein